MAWRSEKKTGVAPALHAAFMATSYCAESEDGALQLALMVGVSDATLDALLAREGQERWAYLTAWNPGARQGSDEDNARRNRALFLDLLKAGARPILSGRGIPEQPSEWPPEASYLAVGLDMARSRSSSGGGVAYRNCSISKPPLPSRRHRHLPRLVQSPNRGAGHPRLLNPRQSRPMPGLGESRLADWLEGAHLDC